METFSRAYYQATTAAQLLRETEVSLLAGHQEALVTLMQAETPVRPPVQFRRALLKSLIRTFERNAHEVHDTLYEMLGELLAHVDDSWRTRTFVDRLADVESIELRESCAMLLDGTTGLSVWTAALALSDWLADPLRLNDTRIARRPILELGCGVGLVSIAAARYTGSTETLLTDLSERVLDVALDNCTLNHLTNVSVEQVDWTQCDSAQINRLRHDSRCDAPNALPPTIVAADVVFDASCVPALASLISRLVARSSAAQPLRHAFVACTIRNPQTYQLFLDSLDSMGLTRAEESLSNNPRVFLRNSTSERETVVLWHIYHNM